VFDDVLDCQIVFETGAPYFESQVIGSYLPSNNNQTIGKTPHPQYQYLHAVYIKQSERKQKYKKVNILTCSFTKLINAVDIKHSEIKQK
jgi:hypothetical protein